MNSKKMEILEVILNFFADSRIFQPDLANLKRIDTNKSTNFVCHLLSVTKLSKHCRKLRATPSSPDTSPLQHCKKKHSWSLK